MGKIVVKRRNSPSLCQIGIRSCQMPFMSTPIKAESPTVLYNEKNDPERRMRVCIVCSPYLACILV